MPPDDDDRISRLEDLVERRLAADSGTWSAEQVKEFIEANFTEQQRAIDQSEREKEKAASALREQLTERIAAGDTNLREHIISQVTQLRLMVENSETLSAARFDSNRREAKIQHEADQAAIAKAEAANESRFAAANEWRGQSADRERTQQEQIASFVATLTPLVKSEAIEDKLAASISRNRADIETLTKRFDVQQGERAGMKITTSFIVTAITLGIGVLGIVIVLANYFTARH